MEKSTKIIIVHLVAQLVVGVIVFAAASQEFNSPMGGLGIALSYFIAAIISIFTSLRVMFSIQKQPRGILFKAAFFSFCLWLFGPYLIAKSSKLLTYLNGTETYAESVKKPTLKAIKDMGFREFEWDNNSASCLVKLSDGKQHRLVLNGDYLRICVEVRQPSVTDTLGWMRTALLESKAYLKPSAWLLLSSSIDSRDFEFETSKTNQISLRLGSSNPYDPVEKWIKGESALERQNRNKLGDLCIALYYGEQIGKKQ